MKNPDHLKQSNHTMTTSITAPITLHRGSHSTWTEGLPTEPGDYWFYRVQSIYKSPSRVMQGRSVLSGNGLRHICECDLIGRVWYMPLTLPEPPEFDAWP
jgi:hypothetical protein